MSSTDNPQFESQVVSGDPAVVPTAADHFPAPSLEPVPAGPPPVEDPAWSGWDVSLIAALAFVVVVLLQLAMAKAAQMIWFPHDTFRDAALRVAEKPILLIALQILLYIPIAGLMIALVEGKYHVPFWRAIAWNWPSSIWKYLAVGCAMLLALMVLESYLPVPKDTPFERLFDRPLDAYLMALIAVTLAPLMEELFFRGFMYPVLARRVGVGAGIFLSALPFALLHLPQYGYSWAAGLVILIVGLVCGIVRAVTKSVGACFLVHAAYNGTQMLIAVLVTHGFTQMPKALLIYCSR